LLICLSTFVIAQNEILPTFVKHLYQIEYYPALYTGQLSCGVSSLDILDIKDPAWTPYGAREIISEGTQFIFSSSHDVLANKGMVKLNYTFTHTNGTQYTINGFSQSQCIDAPSPLNVKINYLPETFDDLDINHIFFTPIDTKKDIVNWEMNPIGGAYSSSLSGPVFGFLQLRYRYNVDKRPTSTYQSFSLKSGSNKYTNFTVPTFLDQYYPPGNVVDIKFYPSNGTNKDSRNPFVIELETTGNRVFAAARYASDPFTRAFYPVSRSAGGKIKYISVLNLYNLPLSAFNVTVNVFNKQNPYIYESYWEESAKTTPSVSSTSSSYTLVDLNKRLSMVNFGMMDLTNINPAEALVIFPNYTLVHDFIGAGNEKVYRYTRSLLTRLQGKLTNLRTQVSRFLFDDIELPYPKTDVTPPKVLDIQFKYLSSGYSLIRVHVTDDETGVSFFTMGSGVVTTANLVSGTPLDGVYELRVQTFYTIAMQYGFSVIDKAGNVESLTSINERYYYTLDKQIPDFPMEKIGYQDITTFRFEPNNINVTSFGSLCTLYFGYKNNSPNNPPPVLIRLTKSVHIMESSFTTLPLMQWDSELNLYKYQFFIPPRLFSGNLDYYLGVGHLVINPNSMYQYFGEKSLLKVYSEISDEMPPIVSSYSFSPSSLTISQGETAQVTLTVNIEDPINGLESGSIKIGSEFDSKVGYSFTFTPVDAINKNPYYGTYEFTFTVNGDCRSQNFKIVEMDLIDTSGHKSSVISDSPSRVSPLYKFYDTPVLMPLTCTKTPDTTPPTIQSLALSRDTIGIVSTERSITVTLTVQDANGVSLRHTPYFYMVDDNWAQNRAPFVLVSSTATTASYKLTYEVPFGFGSDYGFIYGVYGLYDVHLNTNGYSSEDLRIAGFNYIIRTVVPTTPILESYLPILSTGGELQIYGQRLSGSNVIFSIDYRDGDGYQPVALTDQSSISLSIDNILPKKTSLYVRLSVDGNLSNELLVVPTPVKPSQSFCKGNPICGGPNRGYCANVATGCVCYPPYFGEDCLNTDALGGSNPNVNPGSPNTGNNITTDEISFAYYISITELKEYNLNGETVEHYYLKDWTFTNLTTIARKEYKYSTNITKNDIITHISVNLRFFDKQEQVIFAGNEYFMSPNSVKYIVSMSPYGFSSRLNGLELIMASNFTLDSEDGCSSISKGNSSINGEYVQLKVNDHYLYSRFIKLGEIDSKPQQITNKYLDNTEQNSKSIVSYVGVQIPFYSRSVLLDPDFSVLINTDKPASKDKNAVCKDGELVTEDKSGLTKVQIAGIVIGSVGFAAVAVVGATYAVYKNKQSAKLRKNMMKKLDTFNSPAN